MPITTGSYPAALGGASRESPKDVAEDATPSDRAPAKATSGSYDKEFMRGMEEGYQPRRAMAAGIVKC